jgi:hypothetical protein
MKKEYIQEQRDLRREFHDERAREKKEFIQDTRDFMNSKPAARGTLRREVNQHAPQKAKNYKATQVQTKAQNTKQRKVAHSSKVGSAKPARVNSKKVISKAPKNQSKPYR